MPELGNKLATLRLSASEDWSVYELFQVLHQLDILYNRLCVLKAMMQEGQRLQLKKIEARLYNAIAYVPQDNRLRVKQIGVHSPIQINLTGLAGSIREMRRLLKDVLYRNRIEKRELESKAAHAEKNQRIELFHKEIALMRELGFTTEQIREYFLPAFTGPAEKLATVGDEKRMRVLPESRDER